MKTKKKAMVAALLFTLFVVAGVWAAQNVNLAWDANTEADLAGYKLYQATSTGGTCGTFAVVQASILKPSVTTAVVNLPVGTYCFKITAYDTAGNESGFSNTVTFSSTDTTPPGAPVNLRVAP